VGLGTRDRCHAYIGVWKVMGTLGSEKLWGTRCKGQAYNGVRKVTGTLESKIRIPTSKEDIDIGGKVGQSYY